VILFRLPFTCFTALGLAMSFLVDNVHAAYDSGGWKGALFWTAEMLQICLRVAKEYIVVPMGLEPDAQFKMVFFVGVGLAIALDAAILQIRHWRARRRASR
jgi:hypothetical protein